MASANIEYPSLPSPSGTVNVIPKNRLDELIKAAPSVTGASEGAPAGRVTRSSAKGANVKLQSLGAEENLNKQDLREAREYEINRILAFKTEDGRTNRCVEEAFGQFQLASPAELAQVYRELCKLTHPDKQTETEWKEKANEAQQILNAAKLKYDIPTIDPPPRAKPSAIHKRFWNMPTFQASIRELQIDPSDNKAYNLIEMWNKDVEEKNEKEKQNPASGLFPLLYMLFTYRNAHALIDAYKNATDSQKKKELEVLYLTVQSSSEEFCRENGLPTSWAWQYKNIKKAPDSVSESNSSSSPSLNSNPESSSGPGSGFQKNFDMSDAMNTNTISAIDQPEAMEHEVTDPKVTITRQDFFRKIYEEAGPYLIRYVSDPNDNEAKNELTKVNDSIKKRNESDESRVSEENKAKALIDHETLLNTFQKAKPFLDKFQNDPSDMAARQKVAEANKFLKAFNQEHGYPEGWVIGGTALPISAKSGSKGIAASPMVIDNDDEETDVLTREIYNKATGQDTDGKVISWRKIGWGRQALVQYGPRNAALYKLLPASSAPDFDETAIPCMSDHRPGEEKDPETGKWKRTQKDVAALQGVAVHFDSDNPKNSGLTWLDLLDPERHNNDEKLRYTNAVCKVRWADGTEPSFETRTTIRRLWSKSKGAGDQALYMVGKENQRRYTEWKSGQLAREDKSPPPDPAIVNLKQEDAESREGSASSDNYSQRSTPFSSVGDTPAFPAASGKPVPPLTSSTSAPLKKVKRTEAEFQVSWLKRNKLSGDDLEPGQEAAMMHAYDAYLAL